MSDDQRVYSEEEFAIILRKASELEGKQEHRGPASSGFTLSEMRAAAVQVGLDPALVGQAARMLTAKTNASALDRILGGPVRPDLQARFLTRLDEKTAARLLSAVRIAGGPSGSGIAGHSGSTGMTWHDGGELETLSVSARPDEEGTTVSVVVDRRATLGVVSMFSGMSMLLATLFSVFALYPDSPVQGYMGFVAGVGGIAAIARGFWASSTRRVQERLSNVMDAVGETFAKIDPHASSHRAIGDDVSASRTNGDGSNATSRADLPSHPNLPR